MGITITGNITNWYNAPVFNGRKRGGSRKCYNCQSSGYISKNCSKPRIGGRDGGGRGGRGGGGRGDRGGGRRGSGRERDVSRERTSGGRQSRSSVSPSALSVRTPSRSRSRSPINRSRSTTVSIPLPTISTTIHDDSYLAAAARCTGNRTEKAATSTDQ